MGCFEHKLVMINSHMPVLVCFAVLAILQHRIFIISFPRIKKAPSPSSITARRSFFFALLFSKMSSIFSDTFDVTGVDRVGANGEKHKVFDKGKTSSTHQSVY